MSRYFNKFPKLIYTKQGVSNLVTDILTRVSVVKGSFDETSIFYQYSIQEGDTPEMIASKYYGDSELHWVVLIFNNIIDPFYDWPMHYQQFQKYINDKYDSVRDSANGQSSFAYASITPYRYEKIVQTTDSYSNLTTKDIYIVDANTYANLVSHTTETKAFDNGNSVTIDTSKQIISIYDYESELNESKRTIKLVRRELIPAIKTQFEQVMSV
jgi:hypothetical protein